MRARQLLLRFLALSALAPAISVAQLTSNSSEEIWGSPPIGGQFSNVARYKPSEAALAESDHEECDPVEAPADAPLLDSDSEGWLGPRLFPHLGGRFGALRGWRQSLTRPEIYGRVESLHWWTRGMQVPALLTTSSTGTPIGGAGVLGLPTTRILLGDGRFPVESELGRRITLGLAFGAARDRRFEFQYFGLDHVAAFRSQVAPDDFEILARPFLNTFTGMQASQLVGYPGVVDGRIDINTQTDLHGFGFWLNRSFGDPCCPGRVRRVDLILGYRNIDLDDDLSVREQLVSTDPAALIPLGTTFDVRDQFHVENAFHGFDMGLAWLIGGNNKWSFLPTIKLAIGNLHQQIDIRGATDIATPTGGTTNRTGGLLALDSNIGSYTRDTLVVVPEATMNLYYHCGERKRIFVGYNLLVLPRVIRAGGLIDTRVDPRQLPPSLLTGLTDPAPQFQRDDFWAQGFQWGFEMHF